jgi:hypothetical protein
MRRPRPPRGCCAMEKKRTEYIVINFLLETDKTERCRLQK